MRGLLSAVILPVVCSVPDTSSQPHGMSFRVTKALGTRGYDKVRVSLVRYAETLDDEREASPSDAAPVEWNYSSRFQHRWTQYSVSSSIVNVAPGREESFSLDGHRIQVKIPEENQGSIGVLMGDPCIRADPQWCKYADVFQVKTTMQGVLNNLAAHEELDWWAILGDLFYDLTGSITPEFFSGLSMAVAGKVQMAVMGNHDYWIQGHPKAMLAGDSLANGQIQWYVQDAKSAQASLDMPFNFSVHPDTGELAHIDNTFWYNSFGNVAFIGFSNAYGWETTRPYFEEACAWVRTVQPALVVLMGHWADTNDGCPSGMVTQTVYHHVRSMPGCDSLGTRLKYLEGHKHCNFVKKRNTGFLFGSFGFEDGDRSCEGAFGIPILDTRNGEAVLYYFELAKHGRRNENFDVILNCFAEHGLSGCVQHAEVWMHESLEGFPSSSQFVL
mmetsp:Transcript_36209/g.96192  ORF Transcript_36209/g.96192 Transcript_36209/m.96192 type:complete len:443 (-) Transcript_36209:107-1435(-)|eukprot:CAMPEP_0194532270 /NCGR_PEP_ID=MMETSP0253-20130528/69788_1 /TAXON_ID=2966 /ORGANISM="Noctiluca scintillans" /LENGTH=442 /DNA_ID=CAMNT_0039377701 /DNA_START=66 /DNA_END=1394 /DNA_ORIENTATION=+